MARARFVIPPSRPVTHSGRMDVVAIVIGIAMFVILLYMVEGVDRI
jgi:hypothetical protein